MTAINDDGPRYAIYWAPAHGSPLAALGERWLGRTAANEPLPVPTIAGFDAAELTTIIAEPRRYGWHATLKPPFHLSRGVSPAALIAELGAFVERQKAIPLPALVLRRVDSFIALVPDPPSPEIEAFAEACVRSFDRFRAAASDRELARRRQAGLSARQERNLQRWGYPYVMEDFRFHLTLTGPISDPIAERLMPCLQALVAPAVADRLEIDAISLFVQPSAGARFSLARRFRLMAVDRGR